MTYITDTTSGSFLQDKVSGTHHRKQRLCVCVCVCVGAWVHAWVLCGGEGGVCGKCVHGLCVG